MTAADPQDTAPPKHRGPWIWVCGLLVVVVIGLLVWALKSQSDLDTANQDIENLQAQVAKNEQQGSTASTAIKSAFSALAAELGATKEDLAAAEKAVQDAAAQGEQATKDAAAAAQAELAAKGKSAKAQAQTAKANAEKAVSDSKAAVAADCGKAYLAAAGTLFEGDSLSAQVPKVVSQLQGITADCKAAFAGS